MSKLWLSTLVGVALLSSPQINSADAADFGGGTDNYLYSPQPMTQGLAEISGGIIKSGGSSHGAIGAAAAANIPLGDRWNFQPEISVLSVFSPGVATTVSGVVHGYYRDPQSHALGLYAGAIRVHNGSAENAFVIGVDGLLYLSRTTLYAQTGYFDGGSTVGQGGELTGTVRYFPSDNLKFEGSLGFALSDAGTDAIGISATAEKRFAETPFSAFLTGNYVAVNSAPDTGMLMVGARMYFNNESLFANDRTGVTTNFVKLF